MNRFFLDEINKDIIAITGDDYKHAKKVLRLNENDRVLGVYKGKEYLAKIISDDDSKLILNLLEETEITREADVDIHIYQSLPKGSKMDYIIQKNVEIGISRLTPIISDRSLIKIKNKKKEKKKIERWVKISEESAKQSMRNVIPDINRIISFEETVKEIKRLKEECNLEVIVPYENEEINSTKDINFNKKNYAAVIGPEGGFDENEISSLVEIGAKSISLGPRILRTETAALVLSTIILHETDNMRRKL